MMTDPRIEDAVLHAELIAEDPTHGYDQEHRNGPDYDCSSLISTVLHDAGFPISPTSWTGVLADRLRLIGYVTTGIYNVRKRGDIFLTPGKHVVMCVDQNRIVHASINEFGLITGGKPGDQTGKEICITDFYTPSYGWSYHFTYPDVPEQTQPDDITEAVDVLARAVIRGKFGNGNEHRMQEIYKLVRDRVNQILKGE